MLLHQTTSKVSIFTGLLMMLVFSPLWAGDLNVTFDDLNDIKHENYPSGSSRKSYYLDNCYKLGQDCSTKTAADAWCREYMDFPGGGYPNGDVIPVPSGEKSFTMGDKQSCSKDCRTYQSVTCVATNPTTFREPKYRGFRLDTTEKPNGVVDEAVADQYCQKMGFGGRFDSLSRGGGGKPTKRIGDDVLCLSSCGAFDYITCGTFKVTAPTAKKVLETGSTLNITWLSDKSAPVSLELYKGGAFYKTIATEITNTGSYNWIVDSTLAEGADYAIKVTTKTLGRLSKDEVNVTIAKPGIKISLPAGGETYYRVKDAIQIDWLAGTDIGHIIIQLIDENGNFVRTIKSQTLAKNVSTSWDIPADVATGRYKIRLIDYDNASTLVESKAFTISKKTYTLKIFLNNQNGSVKDDQGWINCPGDCEASEYEYGKTVRLTATPKAGYEFWHYAGDYCSTTNPCEFNIFKDVQSTASFSDHTSNYLNVQVTNEGTANGQVSSSPSGIDNCSASGGKCQDTFGVESVQLTAHPDGNSIAEFTSGCSNVDAANNTCTVSMYDDRTAAVKFKLKPGVVTTSKLEFDPFPDQFKYQTGQKIKLKLRVTQSPDSTIQRVDVDWKGNGNGWACKSSFQVNTIVTCEKPDAFTSADLGPQILTATAYSASGKSNMLKFRYEVTDKPDSQKFTGHQNQEHLKKFWTVNPNSNKEAFAVDTATGTQVMQLDFLHQHGLVDLDFSIKYNSGLAKGSSVGTLGRGWNHNYGILAKLEFSNGNIVLNWSEGRKNTFIPSTNKDANCGVSSATEYCEEHGHLEGRLANYFDRISKQGDGSYILKRKDRTQYVFSSSGALTKIVNLKGQTFELTYENSKLKKILQPDSNISLNYVYNPDGSIQYVTDAGGRVVRFYYVNGDLDYLTDPAGNKHDFDYNGNSAMTGYTVTGKNEHVKFFTNTYDSSGLGQIKSQTDGNGYVTSFEYDETQLGFITTKTTKPSINGSSNVITDIYNTNYQLLEHSESAQPGVKTTYAYNEQGMLRRSYVFKPDGSLFLQTEHEYDQVFGKETRVTYQDSTGKSIRKSWEYDENTGNLMRELDELGVPTEYTYFNNNMLKSIKVPFDRNITPTTIHALSADVPNPATETITSPTGKKTVKNYVKGRLDSVVDPEGYKTTYTYDDVGNLRIEKHLEKSGLVASSTTYDYDGLGNIIKVTDAENKSITTEWSIHGEKYSVTDAKQQETRFRYDNNGNLKNKTDAKGNTTQYTYDAQDHLITETDGENRKHHYAYDAKGRLVTEFKGEKNPATDTIVSYLYDQLDRLIEVYKHPSGNIASKVLMEQHEYDAFGRRLKTTTYQGSDARVTVFTPDDKGRVKTLIDPEKHSTAFVYFDNDEIKSVTNALNGVAAQQFDNDGNRTALTDPNTNTTTFDYDGNKKQKLEKPQAGGPFTQEYNALQLLSRRTNGRNQPENYTYYKNGWLKTVAFDSKTYTYTYDDNGNVTNISGTDGSSITRTYDELDRVKTFADSLTNTTIGYEYDKAGNLAALTYPGGKKVQYGYNVDNRLETVTDWLGRVLVRYEYTVDGRLEKETRYNGTDPAQHLRTQQEVSTLRT